MSICSSMCLPSLSFTGIYTANSQANRHLAVQPDRHADGPGQWRIKEIEKTNQVVRMMMVGEDWGFGETGIKVKNYTGGHPLGILQPGAEKTQRKRENKERRRRGESLKRG